MEKGDERGIKWVLNGIRVGGLIYASSNVKHAGRALFSCHDFPSILANLYIVLFWSVLFFIHT
jgi:hypothetical protein